MKKITLLIALSSMVFANTIHIPTDFATVQEGIDASVDGDTVLVSQGMYYENLVLNKEIVLASHAIFDDLSADWLSNENINATIINGSQPSDPSRGSCLVIRDGNIQPTVMGFTLKDGEGTSMLIQSCDIFADRVRSGGGILMYHAYPTINYNRFVDNGSAPSE